MPFLLHVLLPDVPGSLGRVATAIGMAGGDIEAIEIVEKRAGRHGRRRRAPRCRGGTMPDSVVSACSAIEGVEVLGSAATRRAATWSWTWRPSRS